MILGIIQNKIELNLINILVDILINVKMFPKRNIILKEDYYFIIFQNKIKKKNKTKKVKNKNKNKNKNKKNNFKILFKKKII